MYNSTILNSVRAVGFDLDGTLYDELEFILQVYVPISVLLADIVGGRADYLYDRIIHRWKEKGSSYNRIFEEVLLKAQVPEPYKSLAIAQCLDVFRNFQPVLRLPMQVEELLDYYSCRYSIFMVTDGGEKLQRAKIKALGLSRWFDIDNISISGCLGQGISKPDIRMSSPIHVLKSGEIKAYEVIYFGDREVDADYAKSCGYHFMRVNLMNPVNKAVL